MNRTIVAVIGISVIITSCESKTGTGAGGALIGASLDDNDRDNMQRQSPRTLKKIDNGEQLSTDDIKKMAKAGLSDNVIIDQIHWARSTFFLSTADIIDLKNSGVSQKVIDAMIQTGNQS